MLNMTVAFRDWLSTERKAKGLTLEVVGRKAGTHKGYISGILNEKVNPPAQGICAKLAKLFRAPKGYVVFMAYRDKSPLPVRNRIGYLESLRESVERFLEASNGSSVEDQAKTQASVEEMGRLVSTLNEMWPTNGDGHK